MAYAPEEDLNKKETKPEDQTAGPPTTASAPGSGPGSSAGKSTPQSTPAQPFQNLQAYLGANQPQVQQQASQLAGNLTNQFGQVQSDINKGKEAFGSQVQNGYAAPNEAITKQAAENPTDFVSKPENVKAFQSLYNDTYTGPENFESTDAYGNLSGQVSKAKENANLFNSPEGVQTYFQGQNPNATKGGNILDTVLLQGSPEAYNQIKNAAKPFESLPDYLTGATNEANQGVTAAKGTAAKTAQDLKNQYTGEGGIVPTFQNTLQSNLEGKKSEASQRAQLAKEALEVKNPNDLSLIPGQENKYTDQVLGDLGLGRGQLQSMMAQRDWINNPNANPSYSGPPIQNPHIDLASYLGLTQQSPDVALNMENVATPEDYSKSTALSQLTGQDLSFLNPANTSKAGTANLDLSSINPAQVGELLKLFQSQPNLPEAMKPGYKPPVIPRDNTPIGINLPQQPNTSPTPTPTDTNLPPPVIPVTQPVVPPDNKNIYHAF